MKIIKVFSLATHSTNKVTSGVDLARVIQPMKYLNGYKDREYEFDVTQYILSDVDKTNVRFWFEAAQDYDIFFFNYHTVAEGYAMMATMARKFNRKLIMDIDDALWILNPDNPAYDVYKKGSDGYKILTDIVNDVDYVTTTNSYLRNVIVDNTWKKHERVGVFPNYIDLSLYNHKPPFKDDTQVRIAHFGSTTHFNDLQSDEFFKGMDRIMKEYPNVVFLSMGCHIPQYKKAWGARYENGFGDADVYTWIKEKFPPFVDSVDFFVAPIIENTYNRCKSAIKFLEASSSGKPGAWQNIRQYQEVVTKENGFLCQTADQWYQALKTLIDDKEKRKQMGEVAFKTLDEWKIERHVKEYADIFGSLLTNFEN